MEEMKLQVIELQKVKEKFIVMEQKYDLSKINYAEERRKNKSMIEKIKALEKDLTFDRPIEEIKKIFWTNIIDFINVIWASIQFFFEQIDLVKFALEAIWQTREELGRKPEEAVQLINFLNCKNIQ